MEALAIVSKLREELGEETVEDLEKWVKELIQSETRDQYNQILSRSSILSRRPLKI